MFETSDQTFDIVLYIYKTSQPIVNTLKLFCLNFNNETQKIIVEKDH